MNPLKYVHFIDSTITLQTRHFFDMSDSKLSHLEQLLKGYGSTLIAYSGGVDSVFLAFMAHKVLGPLSVAAIADSPSLPRRELQDALAIAKQFGFTVRVIKTAEFENQRYTSNPLNRCYFCKHELFSELGHLAQHLGLNVISYGENATDVGDFRPGAQAAKEFAIRAPLKEANLSKSEIRTFSARFGLPTSDKPQMACLSSRVPHGEPVTESKLQMIESAENLLRDLGFFDVRVRHHELASTGALAVPAVLPEVNSLATPSIRQALARIEVGSSELPRLLNVQTAEHIAGELKRIGYTHVTLDLHGYRRGGANNLVAQVQAESAS